MSGRTRETEQITTETYSYCDSDELIDIKVGGTTVKSFAYDDAGRTTGITYSGLTTTLAYDYESRITSISRSGVTTNTFTYNGLDTRVGKVDSGGTKTYKRDGAYVTDPVLSDGTANYTPGISEKRSGTTRYNTRDYLGSFTRQTDSSQATSGTRSYDAFGLATGTTGSPSGSFGFAGGWGYQEDGDYGLKLLGHRYYDPSIGRFLAKDPLRSGNNWFTYANNNPQSYVDPEGLKIANIELQGGAGAWDVVVLFIIINGINSTKKGKSITEELINGETSYTIILKGPKSTNVSAYDADDRVFRLSIQEAHDIQFKDKKGKWRQFTFTRIVAHELGHIDTNFKTGGSEQDNVDQWENPIMKELGSPHDRGKYGDVRKTPTVKRTSNTS